MVFLCAYNPKQIFIQNGNKKEKRVRKNNVISYVDWMNNFEVNGAVFLPVTGYRENSTVTGTTYHGRYWTSTHRDGGKSAYKFWFDNGGNGKGRWDVHEPWSTADNGFAVRLIRDVE